MGEAPGPRAITLTLSLDEAALITLALTEMAGRWLAEGTTGRPTRMRWRAMTRHIVDAIAAEAVRAEMRKGP